MRRIRNITRICLKLIIAVAFVRGQESTVSVLIDNCTLVAGVPIAVVPLLAASTQKLEPFALAEQDSKHIDSIASTSTLSPAVELEKVAEMAAEASAKADRELLMAQEAAASTPPIVASSTVSTSPSFGTSKRATTDEQLPDPTKLADPSLETITLPHPDYRTTVAASSSSERKASSTIMEMGQQQVSTSTQSALSKAEEKADAAAMIADAAAAAAEAAQVEAEVAAAKEALAETTTSLPQTTSTTTDAPEITTDAPEITTESVSTSQAPSLQLPFYEPIPVEFHIPDGSPQDQATFLRNLTQALANSSQILIQNITVVLPGFNPSAQTFVDSLLRSRVEGVPPQYGETLPVFLSHSLSFFD